jgi:O-antigen biosynthesis protein
VSFNHAFVSLIMPVWRPNEAWLQEAIESVLAQRSCEFELIVVDDGNPTHVEDLLGWLDDPRVRLVRGAHGGQAKALNLGLREARGSHVRFVDCDDVLQAGSTARLLRLSDGEPDVIAYSTTLSCDEQLRGTRRYESRLEGAISRQCLLGEFEVRHVSMLLPRSVVDRAGEWSLDFRVSADRDFIQRVTEQGRVRGDQTIATFYRRHGQSVQGQADIQAGEEAALEIIARYIKRHPEEAGTPLHKRAIANTLLNRARAYEYVGDYRRALSRAAKAAPYAPRRAARLVAGMARRRLKSLSRGGLRRAGGTPI